MNSSNSINKIREYPNSQSANVYHSTSEQFQSAQPGALPTGRQGPPLPPPPSSLTPAATSASVLDLDWYKTPEGQGVLTHLIDQTTGHRKIYGLLELPNVPPTIKYLSYKLFLSGKSGSGKTSLVSYLSGRPNWTAAPNHQVETPGIRVSKVYWPAKVQNQLVLFALDLWDSGDASSRKYGHIQPVCREGAIGGLFIFSFIDKSSYTETRSQLANVLHSNSGVCPIVIGMKYGSLNDAQVSQSDVVELEQEFNVTVLRIRYQNSKVGALSALSNESALILNLVCDKLFVHCLKGNRPVTDTVMI